jgi:hypothetical protein
VAGRSYRHKRKPGGFDSYLLTNVLYDHAEKIECERKDSSPPVDGSETGAAISPSPGRAAPDHAVTARLIRRTVAASTPTRAAILRGPSIRPACPAPP